MYGEREMRNAAPNAGTALLRVEVSDVISVSSEHATLNLHLRFSVPPADPGNGTAHHVRRQEPVAAPQERTHLKAVQTHSEISQKLGTYLTCTLEVCVLEIKTVK